MFFWFLVFGYRFWVDNAFLTEDFSRRKGNPTYNQKPTTHNHELQLT